VQKREFAKQKQKHNILRRFAPPPPPQSPRTVGIKNAISSTLRTLARHGTLLCFSTR